MMVHPCDLSLKASFPSAGLAGPGAWRSLAQQRVDGLRVWPIDTNRMERTCSLPKWFGR